MKNIKMKNLLAENMRRFGTKNLKENINNAFKAEAIIEGDMMMEFPVVGIKISNGKYSMYIFDKISNKNLVVYNFSGPIYDAKTKEQVYTRSVFQNINAGNASKISSQYRIPISTAS